MRLVQGQMGRELADHPARAARGDDRARQGRGQARLRGDDDDEEDRHRRDRGGSEGRMTPARWSAALRAWLIAGTLDIAYAMAWTKLAGVRKRVGEGKGVSVRVDAGGHRIIKNKRT